MTGGTKVLMLMAAAAVATVTLTRVVAETTTRPAAEAEKADKAGLAVAAILRTAGLGSPGPRAKRRPPADHQALRRLLADKRPLDAMEAVEHSRQLALGNPRARVANAQHRPLRLTLQRHCDLADGWAEIRLRRDNKGPRLRAFLYSGGGI